MPYAMVPRRDRSDVCCMEGSFHIVDSMFDDVVDHEVHSCAVRDLQIKVRDLRGIVSTVGHAPLLVSRYGLV